MDKERVGKMVFHALNRVFTSPEQLARAPEDIVVYSGFIDETWGSGAAERYRQTRMAMRDNGVIDNFREAPGERG